MEEGNLQKKDNIIELHADICRTLSSPLRLKIINYLQDKEITAGKIVKNVGASKANISQHLALLKRLGVVSSRKEGKNVYYKISDLRIIKACNLMREVLISQLKQKAKLVEK